MSLAHMDMISHGNPVRLAYFNYLVSVSSEYYQATICGYNFPWNSVMLAWQQLILLKLTYFKNLTSLISEDIEHSLKKTLKKNPLKSPVRLAHFNQLASGSSEYDKHLWM